MAALFAYDRCQSPHVNIGLYLNMPFLTAAVVVEPTLTWSSIGSTYAKMPARHQLVKKKRRPLFCAEQMCTPLYHILKLLRNFLSFGICHLMGIKFIYSLLICIYTIIFFVICWLSSLMRKLFVV